MKRVVIIGGGIAGLSAAYSLREHQAATGANASDVEVIILEKKERLGGNIRTEKKDGFLVEGGPDCFLSEKPWAMELCKRIGLENEIIVTNEKNKKTFVLSGGRLHELPEGVILMVPTKILPLATSSLISIPGKIRMLMEFFIPPRTDSNDESLGSFVKRRLGQETLDKIAEPLVAGVHAGDPDTMSVASSFPKFVQMEKEHGSLIRGMLKRMAAIKKAAPKGNAPSTTQKKKMTMFITLKNGLSTLIDTLTEKLMKTGSTVLTTEATVASVTKSASGFEIVMDRGTRLDADAVIIAAPAYSASALVRNIDPELSKYLLTIPYVSTATITLGYKRADVKHPLNGFGFVVPKKEGRKIMAASWTSVKFAHRAPEDSVLIRCFVGGAKNQELVELADDEMIAMVKKELAEIMGITAQPVLTRIFRWINSMPQYTIGHTDRVRAIDERVEKIQGLYLTGSAYHGIGISDSIRQSEIVAKKVLHFLA